MEDEYVPTEVVEGQDDFHPPLVPGNLVSGGDPGSLESLGEAPDSGGAAGSGVPLEPPGVESAGAGGSVGTSRPAGPLDRVDPWSGASPASVALAVEVVTRWVQPEMQRAMPLPSEVNPWLRMVCSGPRPLLPVVLPLQPLAALSIPAPPVPSEPAQSQRVLPRVGVKRKATRNWAQT
eukprot:2198674-Amphidinium_carterae.1